MERLLGFKNSLTPVSFFIYLKHKFPLNLKVQNLVFALNKSGISTIQSGDLYGNNIVYVDIAPKDIQKLNKSVLPTNWKVIIPHRIAVDFYLDDKSDQMDVILSDNELLYELSMKNITSKRLIKFSLYKFLFNRSIKLHVKYESISLAESISMGFIRLIKKGDAVSEIEINRIIDAFK